MNCSSVDLKAYVLGEAEGAASDAQHIESCESCREEVERLRLTQSALLSLPDQEIPRRIAFVSDKIFEPRWWQRIWHSAPAMGFASALVLAAAIFVHAYARPAAVTIANTGSAQMEQRIQAEVSRRVDTEVKAAVAKVVADSQVREARSAQLLDAAQKQFELQRRSDIAMMQQAAQYYQNKLGQMMVASNQNYGGAQ